MTRTHLTCLLKEVLGAVGIGVLGASAVFGLGEGIHHGGLNPWANASLPVGTALSPASPIKPPAASCRFALQSTFAGERL